MYPEPRVFGQGISVRFMWPRWLLSQYCPLDACNSQPTIYDWRAASSW